MVRSDRNSTSADEPLISLILAALLAVIIIASISSCGRLSAAEAKIAAPKSTPATTPVLIDGRGARASLSVEWLISDPEATVFKSGDGRQLLVIGKPGRYVTIGQRAIDVDKSEDLAAVLIHFTGDGDSTPAPPEPAPKPMPDTPSPQPKPDDSPAIPASEAGKQSYAEAIKIISPSRRDQALKMAGQLRLVQEEIRTGKINVKNPIGLRAGLIKLQEGSKLALGADGIKAWLPWGDWFAGFIYDCYSTGKLANSEAWVSLFSEIIKGLEAVR